MTNLTKFKVRYDADIAALNVSAGTSDQDVADYYNADGVTPDVEMRATREQVRSAINITEFKALDDATRDVVRLVLLSDSIQLLNSNDRAILLDAFGSVNGPITRSNLSALSATIALSVAKSRVQRGGFIGNSKAVTAYDVQFMRLRP